MGYCTRPRLRLRLRERVVLVAGGGGAGLRGVRKGGVGREVLGRRRLWHGGALGHAGPA